MKISVNLPLLITGIALMLCCDACRKSYVPESTFTEAHDPVALTSDQLSQWQSLSDELSGSWGDIDVRYSRSIVPTEDIHGEMQIAGWKGERVSAQLLLWSADSVAGVTCEVEDFKSGNARIPSSVAETHFVRYTLADTTFSVGGHPVLSGDMLDTLKTFDMPARSVRPVWLTIAVPQDAEAGMYESSLTVRSNGGKKLEFPLKLEVQNHTLADPSQWSYHLDLWQHPTAVARAQNLELWSDEHFAAMKPIMSRLARAGQKVVTATLNKDPWNHQCYDGYAGMILWTRHADGTWSYDYAVFDRWVEMMIGLGIDGMINCYSMLPWNCELEYYDEATGETVTVNAEPGTEMFTAMWEPFLTDFSSHLAEKGWLGKTNIAMDERTPEAMDTAVKVLEQCAPKMGFALADMHHSYKKYLNMRDVCVNQLQPVEHPDILLRRQQGYATTFYVCCGPLYPNTFTYSAPYEAELLGWYGLAHDYDGMLRWAYNSWPADPQVDSHYGTWSSGDTYLVYPYNRSSIRMECLIDGIEAAEKVRTLRRDGVDTSAIERVLDEINVNDINDPSIAWREIVAKARQALYEASSK